LVHTTIKSIPTSKSQFLKPIGIQTSVFLTKWQASNYTKSSLFISLSIELCIPKNEVIPWINLILLLSFQGTLYITLEMEELPSMKRNGPSQEHAKLAKWLNVYTFHFTCKFPSLMYTSPWNTTSFYLDPHLRQCASINSKS
jgi:hypothetical protein